MNPQRERGPTTENSFLRSVVVLAGGAGAGQVLTIAATPLLTRLFTPSEFGVLTLFASALGIVSVLVAWRYEYAIPLAESEEEAMHVAILAMVAVGISSVVLGGIILLFAPALSSFATFGGMSSFVWLLPPGAFAVGIYTVLNQVGVRRKLYGSIARTKFNQSLGNVLVSLTSGFAGLGALGLIGGQIAGQALGSGTLLKALRHESFPMRAARFRGVFGAMSRYRRFPLMSGPAGLLNSVNLHAPAILLATIFGPHVAGLFGFTQRIMGMPLTLISNSVSQVLYGEFSEHVRDRKVSELTKLFWKSTIRLSLLGAIAVLPIILFGGYLFPLLFGSEWREAGVYAQVVGLAFWAQFIGSPLAWLNHALERQDYTLIWNVIRAVLVFGCFSIAYYMSFEPLATLVTYSVAVVTSYTILLSLLVRALRAHSSKALSANIP